MRKLCSLRRAATALTLAALTASVALPGLPTVARADLARPAPPSKPGASIQKRLSEGFGHLPLRFEANTGQTDPRVKFLSRGSGYAFFISRGEAVLSLTRAQSSDLGFEDSQTTGSLRTSESPRSQVRHRRPAVLKMRLVGHNASARLEARGELSGKSNYLIGNDPAGWKTDVPAYERVEQKSIYRGIDMVYYGNQQRLEYDFIVAPSSTPDLIELAFEGAERLRIDASGDLILSTPAGDVVQKKPLAYQQDGKARTEIAARYVLKGKHRVGFKVGSYDRAKELVIDPVIAYSSYLGVEGVGSDIAMDAAGNIYFSGYTTATTLPVTSGAYQSQGHTDTRPGYQEDAFVVKLNAAGNQLVYATYLGGDAYDRVDALAVDADGQCYVTGATVSVNFPLTPGAFKTSFNGAGCVDYLGNSTPCYDATLTKLNAAGSGLVYSTLIGGSDADFAKNLALDQAGNAYVYGYTYSSDFPVTPGAFQSSYKGLIDAFVVKMNAEGSAPVYSTYLGGSSVDSSIFSFYFEMGIAVDSQGNAYLTGSTVSKDFPTTEGAFQRTMRGGDGFVTKLNASGTGLVYSTLIGGAASDGILGLALDESGNVYLAGGTYSLDFPTVNAFQKGNSLSPLYKSLNGVAGWNSVNTPPLERASSGPVFTMLAVAPADSNTLYAGTDDGLFKSVDGGTTWAPNGLKGMRVRRMAFDPRDQNTFYAATFNYLGNGIFHSAVFKSTDGGASWATALIDQATFNAIAIDPVHPSTVYAGAQGFSITSPTGVFKSTDDGKTWANVNNGLSNFDSARVYDLAIDRANPSTIYAATVGGVFKSTNGGASWSATGLKGIILDLEIDPRNGNTVYACPDEPNDDESTAASFDPDQGRHNPRRRSLQNNSESTGVLKTTDGGASWKPVNNGFERDPLVLSMALDPRAPSVLYASEDRGLYRSSDAGGSWAKVPELPSNTTQIIVIDPRTSAVYAGIHTSASQDAFVAKLNATGSALIYSSYIGGYLFDAAKAVAVDKAGNAYVVGETDSNNFKVTPGALKTVFTGSLLYYDLFVLKLDPQGGLSYSSYFGGNSVEYVNGALLDRDGLLVIGSSTLSANIPLANAFRSSLVAGDRDLNPIVVKLDLRGVSASSGPTISKVTLTGKKMIIEGENFAQGARIILDGEPQQTTNDAARPASKLISKKAGKKVRGGQEVMIQVQNPDGKMSDQYRFLRQ